MVKVREFVTGVSRFSVLDQGIIVTIFNNGTVSPNKSTIFKCSIDYSSKQPSHRTSSSKSYAFSVTYLIV